MSSLIVPIVIITFLIVMGAYSHFQDKKRREKLKVLSEELGLEYSEIFKESDSNQFYRFPLARMGRDPKATSIIVAETEEQRVVLFDYRYVTGSGKHRKTHLYSALMCSSPFLRLPIMSLEPDHWHNKIATLFGGQDITFENDAAFGARYRLQGPSVEAIKAFLTDKRRAQLLSRPSERMEADGNCFLICRKYKPLKAEMVRSLLEEGLSMWEILREESV